MKGRSEPLRFDPLLRVVLDAASDGILVVDENGRIVTWNRRFMEMLRIPDDILRTGDDSNALAFVLDQLKDAAQFVTRTMELYADPRQESYDVLEFKDGRVFERYSPAAAPARERFSGRV